MKRDLLFMAENLLPLLDEVRLVMVARNRGIRPSEGQSVGKLLSAFIRKADEGELNRLTIEIVILLAARSQSDGGKVLKAAAQTYNVNTDAIALKVKQEFTAKEKAKQPQKAGLQPKVKKVA
jgi:ParB family chromosome partitioning protein